MKFYSLLRPFALVSAIALLSLSAAYSKSNDAVMQTGNTQLA